MELDRSVAEHDDHKSVASLWPPPMLERRASTEKEQALNCRRCDSTNTKFCYYYNYKDVHFCRNCRRCWTEGGSLRNMHLGSGSRNNNTPANLLVAAMHGLSRPLKEPSLIDKDEVFRKHGSDKEHLNVVREIYKRNFQSNTENVLPISNKDLQEKAQKFKRQRSARSNDEPTQLPQSAVLAFCLSFLAYQVKSSSSTPFDFQYGNPSPLLLSLGEVFPMYLSEMVQITMFNMCCFLTLVLIRRVQPAGARYAVGIFLLYASVHYFAELTRKGKASGVEVDCSLFKMPIAWFTTSVAFGLSLIFGSMFWRHIPERGQKVTVDLDDIEETLAEV